MKTIGLIGGMSWESTAHYYRLINEGVRETKGGIASAPLLMHSFDFAPIAAMQKAGEWNALAEQLCGAASGLEKAGAEALLICTNTMHKLAEQVAAATSLPLIHIADPTGAAVAGRDIARVALLGTAFTMEQDFYRARLADRHGLEVLVPEDEDRAEVHRIIYEELVAGRVTEPSRNIYRGVIERLAGRGAQGVILGCTEIMLLVSDEDSPVPLFDTTALHAQAAVDFILS